MSEIKVTQMPEASNINDNDLLMIVQGGYNKKIPKELLGIPTKAHQINVGEDTEYRVNLLKTKNLFDKNSELVGQYISTTDGTLTSNTDWNCSNLIKVKPNTTYTYTTVNPNTTISQIEVAFYNGTTFISGSQQNDSDGGEWNYTFTTPANCTNVRVSYRNGRNNQSIQLEEGSTATEYTPFIPNQINVDNEKYSDTINVGAVEDNRSRVNVLYSKNLFNKNDVLTNKYVDPATGEILSSNSRISSNYIELKANTDYVFSNATDFSTNGKGIAFYNSNKEFISGTSFSNLTNNKITTPANTSYMIFSYDNSSTQFNNIILQEGNTSIVPSIKVDNEEIYRKPKVLWENSSLTSSFANQTITLNDSIDNYSYFEIIYRHDTSYGRILSTGKIPSNSVAWLQLNRNYNYFRLANVNAGNQVTIADCNYFGTYGSTTTTTANNYIIPLQIIGY